jgi:N-acetylmuramoyl-L-alanine amidase
LRRIYQKIKHLYGCLSNTANPAIANAYSGAWVRDARDATLIRSTENEAVSTPGIVLIRKPPLPGDMGHVALSTGDGKTIEAAGRNLGVVRGEVRGRLWHHYAKIPAVVYTSTGITLPLIALPPMLMLKRPNMRGSKVLAVQRALKREGFNAGLLDGQYGPHTLAAVTAFQMSNSLVADGVVGPETAAKLGVIL